MKNLIKNLSLPAILCLTVFFNACIQDKFDQPPTAPGDLNIIPNKTIADLKAMYSGTSFQITDSIIISGVVTADDKSGNFYKQIVIQDSTSGILIRMNGSNLNSDYPMGRRVYVSLRGLYLGSYGGLIQIGGAQTAGTTDQVDPIPQALFSKYIFKGSLGNVVNPTVLTISQLGNNYQNVLVQIPAVEFVSSDTGQTYADPIGFQSVNRTLTDCDGNTIIVRSSGYSSFAPALTPGGNGTVTAIYTVFNSTPQLVIRDTYDVNLNSPRCAASFYLFKDFEDGSVTSGGWTQQNVVGTINWTTATIGSTSGTSYGICKNYVAPANIACETWLISPAFDLSASTNPNLTFLNAYKYTGAPLQVLVSTNYTSGLPSTGTWTLLSFALSTGNFAWISSGNVSLSSYKTQNVRIAFKYTGSSTDGSTWEIDDILVKEL
jgi:hypothetical protein